MSGPGFAIKPSDEVIQQAVATMTVADKRGRTFTLKKPGVLAQYRLIEMLGDTASNQTFVNMVLPLLFVEAIDGEPVHRITKRSELDALIQRLDEDGIEAVMTGVADNFGKPDPEADREKLKN